MCWQSLSTHFDHQLSCKSWASKRINVSIGWLFDEFLRCWTENVCMWIWAKTACNRHIIQGINSQAKHKQAQGPKRPIWLPHKRRRSSPCAWHIINPRRSPLGQSDASARTKRTRMAAMHKEETWHPLFLACGSTCQSPSQRRGRWDTGPGRPTTLVGRRPSGPLNLKLSRVTFLLALEGGLMRHGCIHPHGSLL